MNFLLSLLICFAGWWIVTTVVMSSVITKALSSRKFEQASFFKKLSVLYIPQSLLLAAVSAFLHWILTTLGF